MGIIPLFVVSSHPAITVCPLSIGDDKMKSFKSALDEYVQRFRNRHFFEASMATAALLALADDEILMSQRLALDFVLENVEELKVFDVHKAVNLFREYAGAIKADVNSGKEKVFKVISRFSGDEHAAELLIRAGVVIAKADGDFSEQEKEVIAELCRILKLDSFNTCIQCMRLLEMRSQTSTKG